MAKKTVADHGYPKKSGLYWCYFPYLDKCKTDGYLLCKVVVDSFKSADFYDASEHKFYDPTRGEYTYPKISEFEKLESYYPIPKPKVK
nr:hypothetical protein [uncultured Flavobacterium sp.]